MQNNTTMKAWVLEDWEKLVFTDIPVPTPEDDEVLLRVESMPVQRLRPRHLSRPRSVSAAVCIRTRVLRHHRPKR